MHKILPVIRHELTNTFQRKTYLAIAFGLPVLLVLILAAKNFFQNSDPEDSQPSPMSIETELVVEGYVDQSNLVQAIPSNITKNHLIPYTSEELAHQALLSGDISAYYVIPMNYLEDGEIFYVYPDSKPLISDGQAWVMQWTLMFNLLGGDEEMADRVWNPIRHLNTTSLHAQAYPEASGEDCSRPGFACQSNDLVRYLPSIIVALFFGSFMASSSMLFNSVASEKENRTIEVLLLSLHPRQLLIGKTVSLGFAGLLQTAVWLGAITLSFMLGRDTFNLPENFIFPANILIWSLVFFLGGYAIYASLMAGAGALISKVKEASAANFIVMLPLMIGYLVGLLAPIAGATDNTLPVVLSLFPLTAPVVMTMRLTDGIVPLWQLLLSAGLTYLTAYLTLLISATMFKAQNLLSGETFSLGRYLRAFISASSLPSLKNQ